MTLLHTIAVLVLLRLGFQLWLTGLNLKNLSRFQDHMPDSMKPFMAEETFDKAVRYSRAKEKFSLIEDTWSALLLAVCLFSGVLHATWLWLAGGIEASAMVQAAVILAIMLVISLLSWPLDYYAQFFLEERFGFNTSTRKIWFMDRFKGVLLSVILGLPLLWLILFIVEKTGTRWWLWAWFTVVAFQVLMTFLAPKWILPLFNKLTPIEGGSLKQRLLRLADNTRFKADEILIMDGSKRSRHSNAFFTGFGRFKKIVLFDTLIENLSEEEVEAVLAHEIGHYRLKHIPIMMLFSFLSLFIALVTVDLLANTQWFLPAFGFASGNMGAAFLLVLLAGGLIAFWFSPLSHQLSRKFEYQADAFAAKSLGSSAPLRSALRKLGEQNLSNPVPHPIYSGFYYSHPTLIERDSALSKFHKVEDKPEPLNSKTDHQ